MQTTTAVDLDGAIIELGYSGGDIAYVTTHYPLHSGPGIAERIDAELDNYLPCGSTLSQEDYWLSGRILITKWKVNYE